jgi:hypothetical protein
MYIKQRKTGLTGRIHYQEQSPEIMRFDHDYYSAVRTSVRVCIHAPAFLLNVYDYLLRTDICVQPCTNTFRGHMLLLCQVLGGAPGGRLD